MPRIARNLEVVEFKGNLWPRGSSGKLSSTALVTLWRINMPKEFRKRGKKAKKSNVEKDSSKPEHQDEISAGPSWIISTTKDTEEPEAPFGYLDTDVKAYFRTVDVQIRNWQENEVDPDNQNADIDPNEGVDEQLAITIKS